MDTTLPVPESRELAESWRLPAGKKGNSGTNIRLSKQIYISVTDFVFVFTVGIVKLFTCQNSDIHQDLNGQIGKDKTVDLTLDACFSVKATFQTIVKNLLPACNTSILNQKQT